MLVKAKTWSRCRERKRTERALPPLSGTMEPAGARSVCYADHAATGADAAVTGGEPPGSMPWRRNVVDLNNPTTRAIVHRQEPPARLCPANAIPVLHRISWSVRAGWFERLLACRAGCPGARARQVKPMTDWYRKAHV